MKDTARLTPRTHRVTLGVHHHVELDPAQGGVIHVVIQPLPAAHAHHDGCAALAAGRVHTEETLRVVNVAQGQRVARVVTQVAVQDHHV